MRQFLLKPRTLAGAVLGVAALAMYTVTLAPGVLANDSGEWQAAGATLGISHPPGSPAYTLIGRLFALLPLGSPAARVSYVSAVMGAAGVVAVFALALILLDRMLPALVSGVTLAVAGLWWSHSSVATPYNAIPAFIAILLILLLLWRRSGNPKLVYGGALLAGFGLSYHPSLLFFLPSLVLGLFLLGSWRRLVKPKTLLLTLGCLLAGLSFYIYLPLRSSMHPAIGYAPINSVSSFIKYVSASNARGGEGSVLRAPSVVDVVHRLSEVVRQSFYPSFAFLVFGPAIILFYPAVWPRLKPIRRELAYLAVVMVLHMAIVFTISGVVYAQYYMPLLLYFSLWAGFSVYLVMRLGEAYLPADRLRYLPVVTIGFIYFGFLLVGVPMKWSFVNHRQDHDMRNYLQAVFENTKPGAVVLANWDSYTGLRYAQVVDGVRKDLKVQAVSENDWSAGLPGIRRHNPGAQILLSRTLPFDQSGSFRSLSKVFPLDLKGRTYQDFQHGAPAPAAVQLFDVTSSNGAAKPVY